ncbi:MAG: hypothetical protein ABFS42_12415 [Candidatus Krumholzibacteriota bacterium]
MKIILLFVAIAALGLTGLAHGQCNTDPNEIGIFWDQDCTTCTNCLYFTGGPAYAYVILINCTQPAGISGFEFCLVNADGTAFLPTPGNFISGYTYPPGAINAHTEPCFAVGLASPMPSSPCMTLITINLLIFGVDPWCFGVMPSVPASIPGHMAYADGANPGLLLPMYPNTGPGATDYAMACVNSPICDQHPVGVEESSWGSLKSLYR